MSIFDYFAPKAAGEQDEKRFSPTPYRKLSAALDAAADEARARYPEDGAAVERFIKELKEACRTRCKTASAGGGQPLPAAARFALTQDRMRAYACLLPPENGGDGLAPEEFLAELDRQGVRSGILREEIPRELARGCLRIFPVARGTLPTPGTEGSVTELFPRREPMCLDVQGGKIDFHQALPIQPIRKGTAICRIQPPTAGTDGWDVTGKTLPCRQPGSVPIPQGDNTAVSPDGLALVAGTDGLLCAQDDGFRVLEQRILDSGAQRLPASLKVPGELCIIGDVDGGTVVEATGDIVISGTLGAGRVTSTGGSIRVQRGVRGTREQTFLTAARQVQAPVLEQAEINAGNCVIAESVADCTIHCDGTVYALTGYGSITGSLIRAGDSILCLQIGKPEGAPSQFSVGYPPHSPESWNQLRNELSGAKSTVKKLWDTITQLRKKGTRITDKEKAVLDQLVEQRNLYLEKQESLAAELAILDKVLEKKSGGRIRCGKLYPVLDVQIGRQTQEITSVEENCNIRAINSQILIH